MVRGLRQVTGADSLVELPQCGLIVVITKGGVRLLVGKPPKLVMLVRQTDCRYLLTDVHGEVVLRDDVKLTGPVLALSEARLLDATKHVQLVAV
jgi:hypothetical protein